MSCVCTPSRHEMINGIMACVAPQTFEETWERCGELIDGPHHTQVLDQVQKVAQNAVAERRAIDQRTDAVINEMAAFVRHEDALEDAAYRRNTLFDAVHGFVPEEQPVIIRRHRR